MEGEKSQDYFRRFRKKFKTKVRVICSIGFEWCKEYGSVGEKVDTKYKKSGYSVANLSTEVKYRGI